MKDRFWTVLSWNLGVLFIAAFPFKLAKRRNEPKKLTYVESENNIQNGSQWLISALWDGSAHECFRQINMTLEIDIEIRQRLERARGIKLYPRSDGETSAPSLRCEIAIRVDFVRNSACRSLPTELCLTLLLPCDPFYKTCLNRQQVMRITNST